MLKLASMAAAVALSAPAMATTYDYADMGAPFSYGTYTGGSSFNAFTFGCPSRPDLGATCYRGGDGDASAHLVFSNGTSLIAHPGTSMFSNTAVIFTAPTSSLYTINLTIALADPNAASGDGVQYGAYLDGFGAFALGNLLPPYGSSDSSVGGTASLFLNAGQRLAVVIDKRGGNNYDTVTFTGNIAAVPEPATWGLMIGGFALVGAAMRRRKATVAFA